MNNFKIIYRILSELEKSMDMKKCNLDRISYEQFGITEERWNRYIEMLVNEKYIKGVTITENIFGDTIVNCDKIKLTLKGLEYLHENSTMKKTANAIKGIVEIIT